MSAMKYWTWKHFVLGVLIYVLGRAFVDVMQFEVRGAFFTAFVIAAVFAELRSALRTGAE